MNDDVMRRGALCICEAVIDWDAWPAGITPREARGTTDR